MQQLHLRIIGPRSLLEMGLGARPQEPSIGVLTSESYTLPPVSTPLQNQCLMGVAYV